MGSSSSFTVGLLARLPRTCKGKWSASINWPMEGIHVEQELLQETVGSQDQVMAAYGGLNHVRFLHQRRDYGAAGDHAAERRDELNSYLMLFYTGIKRTASDVAGTLRQPDRRPPAADADHATTWSRKGLTILGQGDGPAPLRRSAARSVAGEAEPQRRGGQRSDRRDLRRRPGGRRVRRQTSRRRRRRFRPASSFRPTATTRSGPNSAG